MIFPTIRGADLHVDHASEMLRIDHRIFPAIFFINRRMFRSNGIYGMEYAGGETYFLVSRPPST